MPEILTITEVRAWRRRHWCAKVVATNGCFDLIHVGHVHCLDQAASHGDLLVVGLNDDESVRALKGPSRPVNTSQDRAEVLAGLRAVDAVCVFPGFTATEFLSELKPDVYVKGGDYSPTSLNSDEKAVLDRLGAAVYFVPQVLGKSTSATMAAIRYDIH